ncbi:hypothetical protein [Candidatus Williamhamiltonella defendens]|uniref:hypothetical protein n=1 Tax=Candidatus Williamhamiltonella defendens TaxID=138072 RepID=UPI0012FD2B92|nr:hypothetical protein [Candidatus Hamiltonella defensa]
MASLSLIARYPKRYRVTGDSQHDQRIAPNLLDRQLSVNTPNQVWTTDITVPVRVGSISLSSWMDIHAR